MTWSPTSMPGGVRPDFLHHPGALMAAAERVRLDRNVPGGEVVVRMAETRRRHLHQQLTLPRLVELDVDDLVRARRLGDDSTASSHVVLPW